MIAIDWINRRPPFDQKRDQALRVLLPIAGLPVLHFRQADIVRHVVEPLVGQRNP